MLQIYGSWEKLEEARNQQQKNRANLAERRFEKKLKHMRSEVLSLFSLTVYQLSIQFSRLQLQTKIRKELVMNTVTMERKKSM